MLRAFRRVEIEEAAPGGLGLCASFIEAMTLECGLVFAETSKFEEGLEAAGLEPGAALDFGSTVLDGDGSAAAYGFALLRQYWRDFLKREPGTRLGEDPEELHDMRVAARRLRSAMSIFRPVLPDGAEGLREELGWAGRSLGHVRDLDVQIEWLESVRAESDWQAANALGPLIEELLRRRETARSELLVAMGSERFDGLVAEMSGFLRAGAPEDGGGPAIRPFARKVLRKRYRQFRREGESIEAETEAALYHAARIRAKRLRYATAGFGELYGEPALALVESVKAVQDLLGEHQDCAVTVDWLGRIAGEHSDWPPATYVRIGELMERQRGRMTQIRQEWPEAFGTVRKAWRPVRRQFKQPKAAVVVVADEPQVEPEDPEEEPSGIEPASVVPTPEHRTRLRVLLGYLRRRR